MSVIDGREVGEMMMERQVVSEKDAYRLLAHLVTSAEICTFEPYYYGTFRLIDAASRLMDSMLQVDGPDDPWLREFKREIDEKKVWMMWDREGYYQFLREAPGKLARELKRRGDKAVGEPISEKQPNLDIG